MKKVYITGLFALVVVIGNNSPFKRSRFIDYNASGGTFAYPNAASISIDNCLVVAGDYGGRVQFYKSNLYSVIDPQGIQYGGFIIKYDQSNTPIWVKSVLGARINAIVQDDACNIYIGGAFNGNVYLDPDSTNIPTFSRQPGEWDGFIAKYNQHGKFIKAFQFTGYSSEVTKLAFAWGKLYVGGFFFNSIAMQSGKFFSRGDQDIFLCSYDNSSLGLGGNGWEKQFSGPSKDEINDLYYDRNKELLIAAGTFINAIDIDKYSFSGSPHEAGFLAIVQGAKVSNAFAITGTNSSTRMNSACLNKNGKILCTGSFAGTTDFDPSTQTLNYTSYLNKVDMFVGIYDLTGYPLKINAYRSNGVAQGKTIRADHQNNIILSGNFDSSLVYDKKNLAKNLSRSLDVFLMKLDENGNFLDITTAGGVKDDHERTMAVSHNLPRIVVGALTYSPVIKTFNNQQKNTPNNFYVSIYNE